MNPVAFFVFNRPGLTRRVFDEIRRARPSKLMIVADGPRPGHPTDAEQCALTRRIADDVDWPCDLATNFAESNLGCGRRLASGLDWVFAREDAAIVLEDDCLPHSSFFPFCDELLDRFASDERVLHVGGANLSGHLPAARYSYRFSKNIHVWGWASWSRAWKHYDFEMKSWREFQEQDRAWDVWGDRFLALDWNRTLGRVARGEIDTWDFQWAYACQIQGGLGVVPAVNLVKNIGFGDGAAHATHPSRWADLPIGELRFPLCHPPFFVADRRADRAVHWSRLSPESLIRRFFDWRTGQGRKQ